MVSSLETIRFLNRQNRHFTLSFCCFFQKIGHFLPSLLDFSFLVVCWIFWQLFCQGWFFRLTLKSCAAFLVLITVY